MNKSIVVNGVTLTSEQVLKIAADNSIDINGMDEPTLQKVLAQYVQKPAPAGEPFTDSAEPAATGTATGTATEPAAEPATGGKKKKAAAKKAAPAKAAAAPKKTAAKKEPKPAKEPKVKLPHNKAVKVGVKVKFTPFRETHPRVGEVTRVFVYIPDGQHYAKIKGKDKMYLKQTGYCTVVE